tara:strand:- start:2636 stop:5482 length:2847 start_codon:yes stop_codon:yes gene_type:complete
MNRFVLFTLTIAAAMVAVWLPELAWASTTTTDPCAGVLFCVPHTDLSANWIKATFPDLVDLGGPTTTTTTTTTSAGPTTVLGNALKVLNSGALAVGSLVLTYKLFAGIVQTANDGEVLGKRWSTLWGPVRVAGSAALIVPTATGYCLAQALVVSIALTGVGLANKVWSVTVDGMLTTSGGMIAPQMHPHYEVVGKQVLANNICLHMSNYYLAVLAQNSSDYNVVVDNPTESYAGSGGGAWGWISGGNPYGSTGAGATAMASGPLLYRSADWKGADVASEGAAYVIRWTPVGQNRWGQGLNRWVQRVFGGEFNQNACGAIKVEGIAMPPASYAATLGPFARLVRNVITDDAEIMRQELNHEMAVVMGEMGETIAEPLWTLAQRLDGPAQEVAYDLVHNHIMTATAEGVRYEEVTNIANHGATVMDAVVNFGETVRTNVDSRIQSVLGDSGPLNPMVTEFKELAKEGGWVTAGEWFLQLMRLNGTMQRLLSLSTDTEATMDLASICRAMSGGGFLWWGGDCGDGDSADAFRGATDYINSYYERALLSVPRNANMSGSAREAYVANLNMVMGTMGVDQVTEGEDALERAQRNILLPTLVSMASLGGCLKSCLGSLLGRGVTTAALAGMGGYEDTVGEIAGNGANALLNSAGMSIEANGANPIASIISFGRTLWANGLAISFAADAQGSTNMDRAIVSLAGGQDFYREQMIGSIASLASRSPTMRSALKWIGNMMLIPGALLGYIFPYLPWLLWIGGLIGWFVLVLEAVIAAPLWALAHMRMDGEGIMGPAGQQGYMLALSLLLRPALMIIGMLCGMILIYVMIPFAGLSLMSAFSLGKSAGAPVDLVGQVMSMALMAFVMVTISYKAFGLINSIPDSVLRWISAGSGGAGEDEFKSGAMAIVNTGAMGGIVSAASSSEEGGGGGGRGGGGGGGGISSGGGMGGFLKDFAKG